MLTSFILSIIPQNKVEHSVNPFEEEVTRLSLLARHCRIEEEQDRYRIKIKNLINVASKEVSEEFVKKLDRIVKTILIQC